jgi:TolB-like protein
MDMKRLGVALLLGACLAEAPAVHATQPIITVMDFTGSDVSQSELALFSDFITSHIVQTAQYTVVDRMQRQALLEEIEFSNSDCADERCQLEIGRILAADSIIVGSLGRFGGRFILNIKLIDVETGGTANATSRTYVSLDELLEDSQSLTLQLLRIGTQVSATEEPGSAEKPPPTADTGPALIKEVPIRTIKVNGEYTDWTGVEPAFIDVPGDNHTGYPGSDITRICMAKDQQYLYVFFSLSGKGLPASPPGFMNAMVVLNLGNGEYLNLSVFFSKAWQAQLDIWSQSSRKTTVLAPGFVKRKGNGFEARFPLKVFYKHVRQGEKYATNGQVGAVSGDHWMPLDVTGPRLIGY